MKTEKQVVQQYRKFLLTIIDKSPFLAENYDVLCENIMAFDDCVLVGQIELTKSQKKTLEFLIDDFVRLD
jgi:hypothetical protein